MSTDRIKYTAEIRDLMDDYGLHLLSVSSHAGARPKCAKDQGKIFNRSGGGGYTEDLYGKKIRYYAWKDSSYGEPDGLLGINCGHQVYPFVPGLDVQRYFPYDEKENAELYEKTQQQRELERRVRRSKRECVALETVGDEEGLRKASATLKQRQQALRQYCEDNGLSYKPDRTAVVGYNRTVAGKVNAVNRGKTLDISGGSGIIKERSSGKGNRSADHYAEKIGTIDFNDKNAVTKSLVEFETKYMESDIEHCRVITPSGDVFEVHGDRYTVDTSILGDKLKGSINEHNHVTGESQYSFSWEDLASSVSDGSEMSLAYDERYRYWMIMPDYPISESQLYEAYQNAITSVGDDLIFSPEKIPEGDEQHERIKRACEELGIRYQRVLIAD